jgi:hypothetical protein
LGGAIRGWPGAGLEVRGIQKRVAPVRKGVSYNLMSATQTLI